MQLPCSRPASPSSSVLTQPGGPSLPVTSSPRFSCQWRVREPPVHLSSSGLPVFELLAYSTRRLCLRFVAGISVWWALTACWCWRSKRPLLRPSVAFVCGADGRSMGTVGRVGAYEALRTMPGTDGALRGAAYHYHRSRTPSNRHAESRGARGHQGVPRTLGPVCQTWAQEGRAAGGPSQRGRNDGGTVVTSLRWHIGPGSERPRGSPRGCRQRRVRAPGTVYTSRKYTAGPGPRLQPFVTLPSSVATPPTPEPHNVGSLSLLPTTSHARSGWETRLCGPPTPIPSFLRQLPLPFSGTFGPCADTGASACWASLQVWLARWPLLSSHPSVTSQHLEPPLEPPDGSER